MIWEVFRQASEDAAFTYCRDVHAPDREMAKQFAVIQHGRRKPTHALWVAPQDEVGNVAKGDELGASTAGNTSATWQVFSPNRQGYHTHVGSVEATDTAGAKRAAIAEFAEDDENLWVIADQVIGEVTADEVTFGGSTNKAYRFAQTYNIDPAAEEVEASEQEQIDAEQRTRSEI